MNFSSVLNLVGTFGAIVAALVLYVQITRLKEETNWLKASLAQTVVARELRSSRPAPSAAPAAAPAPAAAVSPAAPVPTGEEGEMELAGVMAKLQLHANKLYFAGSRQNWALADFYVEEIEETVKDICKRRNIMHGQINISGLMPALLLPEVEKLEATVARKDPVAFRENYTALTAACNACHTAARKAFIVIEDPRTPALDNQRYEPVASDANPRTAAPPAN
jgi:hypothetical protein